MSEVVTLELPAELMRQARELAAATNRRFEDAVCLLLGTHKQRFVNRADANGWR
mgnify:CR=1 FL=1